MSATRIWLNGDLLSPDAAHIAPTDRGLLLADGLFETLLAQSGRIIRLDRHIVRLTEGASILKIPLPFQTRTVRAAARETLEANGLNSAQRASLRSTLTRGPAGRGVALPAEPKPTLMITAAAAPPAPESLSVLVSSVSKLATSPASPLKTLNYTDNVMARMEADTAGADEALMRCANGGIACATIGNVFAVHEGALITPPDDGSIRAGITRSDVLALARETGLV
ncbi:MAG: aminotransferase class IV, partial [Candidatus Phaeomarinobacter sp.]